MQIVDAINTKEKELEKTSQAADIIAQKDITEKPTRSELAENEIEKNDKLAMAMEAMDWNYWRLIENMLRNSWISNFSKDLFSIATALMFYYYLTMSEYL